MTNNQSCAEAMDIMNSRIAIGFLLASITYALDASVFLLADHNSEVFRWIGFSTSLLAAGWIFWAVGPGVIKKIKNRNFIAQEPESFITEIFHKAMIKSWIITIAVLMLLKVFDRLIAKANLPSEFYFNGIIFIMLLSSSVAFLIMSHEGDSDPQEDGLMK